jgi:dolichyl-phosphate-mannose--protein O-mannosyl transferase
VIRLEHERTRKNLHSHSSQLSPVTGQQEVTAFGENGGGDFNDNWRVEVDGGGTWSTHKRVRLAHVETEYVLHSHKDKSDPENTMGQQEVTSLETVFYQGDEWERNEESFTTAYLSR